MAFMISRSISKIAYSGSAADRTIVRPAIDPKCAVTVDSPRMLLVASTFKVPYRVLRCAKAIGATVHVFGTRQARGLRYSRYCSAFLQFDRQIDGDGDPELESEINHHIDQLKIDIVLAGDAPSTRSLIKIQDQLRARCFPMPTLEQFDLLNNKSRFGDLCQSLGIRYPAARVYPTVDELERYIVENGLKTQHIAKPLSLDGSIGCIVFRPETAREQLPEIFYEPVLVQEFIDGEDIGASVYCERGEIRAFLAHSYNRDTYYTFFDQKIYDDIAKLMRHLKTDGIFNFDMRLAPDGQVWFLECNPRVFFKIALSMLAGINFIWLGLPGRLEIGPPWKLGATTVRYPKAFLVTLLTPWKLGHRCWEALKFVLSDPLPYIREELKLEQTALPPVNTRG
jgi:ATP-grasp in the biosynthetic pathway with Ter operon